MPSVDANAYAQLDPVAKKVVDQLLATIAMQADQIGLISELLSVAQGTLMLQSRVLSGPSLVGLAAKLNSPPVTGVTGQQLDAAITDMQKKITQAADAQQVFSSIFAFALKVAPLALA